MLQFILAALVALCAQSPTDEQVLAALPSTEARRTDISIVKTVTPTANDGRPAPTQWRCIAYFTETHGDVSIRRVQVVYLTTLGK